MISKKDFPIFEKYPELVYLDAAATTQKPAFVLSEFNDWYTNYNANIHRGLYSLSQKATDLYEEARNDIAKLFRVLPEETIFTKSSTEGLNLLAQGFRRIAKAGQSIVVSDMEHHSNLLPWLRLAREKGLEIRFIPIKDNYIDIAAAKKLIDKTTLVVAITHASNVLGTIQPLKELSEITSRNGSYLVVDGSQAVPHVLVAPWLLGCHAYVLSGHKAYSLNGSGVVFIKKELGERLEPLLVGGDMVSNVSLKKTEYLAAPLKFEGGTQNPAAQISLKEALLFLYENHDAIFEYENKLKTKLFNELERLPITIYNKNAELPMATFSIENLHSHDVASLLNEKNIAIRAGFLCAQPLVETLNKKGVIRVSLGLWNTIEDIDNLIVALKEVVRKYYA